MHETLSEKLSVQGVNVRTCVWHLGTAELLGAMPFTWAYVGKGYHRITKRLGVVFHLAMD